MARVYPLVVTVESDATDFLVAMHQAGRALKVYEQQFRYHRAGFLRRLFRCP